MRGEPNLRIDRYRLQSDGWTSPAGVNYGAFRVTHKRHVLWIISSGFADCDGACGWEHVSVSVEGDPDQTPTWDDMCLVKDLFWRDDETVVQFHPRKDEAINHHPGVLHLWRRADGNYTLPPAELIGPRGESAR